MRQNKSTVRAVFMFMVALGCSLNIVQMRKLGNGRNLKAEETSLSVVIKAKQPSSVDKDTEKQGKKSGTTLLVKPDDYVFSDAWDASPIVVESHKLVFFTVPKAGCTVWKQLFRRMMGYKNWQKQSTDNDFRQIPHNPNFNGLTYLHQYSLEEANRIMTSPEYTRAIFVRDPKERLLSAFLDKALSNGGAHVQNKCCPRGDCMKEAQIFPGFINLVFNKGCRNPHWNSQSRRMEPKYWKYVDFVGHVETASSDAKELLQKVGAWEKFGASGWGANNNKAIFDSSSEGAVSHVTWAKWRMWKYYTPELESIVENFYATDYANPVLNMTRSRLY